MKNMIIALFTLTMLLPTSEMEAQRRVGPLLLGGALGYAVGYDQGRDRQRDRQRERARYYDDNRYADRMSRDDRRYLRNLEAELDELWYRALRDDYLDISEKRRIREVEREIDFIVNRYRQRDRDRRYYRTGCR